MNLLQAAARLELAELEEHLGEPLHDQPIHITDQWTAAVRDLFGQLGTDLNQPQQAKAALAGAYIVAATLLNGGSQVPWPIAVGTSHLWRYLVDQVDQQQVAPRRRRWWQRK